MTHYFRCIKGLLIKEDDNTTNILSHKNELWKVTEWTGDGAEMICVEGASFDWEFFFTNKQLCEHFEWEKSLKHL